MEQSEEPAVCSQQTMPHITVDNAIEDNNDGIEDAEPEVEGGAVACEGPEGPSF